MTITFEDEYGRDWPFSPEELAVQVAEACLDYENCPYEAQVNILLTGNEEIRQMNRQFGILTRRQTYFPSPWANTRPRGISPHRGGRGFF